MFSVPIFIMTFSLALCLRCQAERQKREKRGGVRCGGEKRGRGEMWWGKKGAW